MAHFAGVQLCGSIHVCPVCSPRIRQSRADDVDAAAREWIERHGAGAVMLLTLTMPHDHGEALSDLLKTVRVSFGAMVAGKAWQTDKATFGVQYYIVSHDATVGRKGWHPHLHVLLFADRVLSDSSVAALGSRLHKRWSRAVTRRGHRPPTRRNGITLERARSRKDVTAYVCQVVAGNSDDDARTKPVALEMTRGDLKLSHRAGQRTPWQVLSELAERRAREGEWTEADERADNRDVALWREWERATKGVRAIRWARGLRAAVGLIDEKTDEDIVAEEVGGMAVYRFVDADSWRAVTSTPGARARVLSAAETGDSRAIETLVTRFTREWRQRRTRRLASRHGLLLNHT